MICSILKKHLKKSHSTMNVVVWFVANTLCVCGFQDTRNLGVCFLYKQKKKPAVQQICLYTQIRANTVTLVQFKLAVYSAYFYLQKN